MKKLVVLPTFIIMKLVMLLVSDSHPLKKQKITLSKWAKDGTLLTYDFSVLLWVSLIISGSTIFYLLLK